MSRFCEERDTLKSRRDKLLCKTAEVLNFLWIFRLLVAMPIVSLYTRWLKENSFVSKRGMKFSNHRPGHIRGFPHDIDQIYVFPPSTCLNLPPLCCQPHRLRVHSSLRTIMTASEMQIMHNWLWMLKQNQTSAAHSAWFYRQVPPLLGCHCLLSLMNLPYWAYNAASPLIFHQRITIFLPEF